MSNVNVQTVRYMYKLIFHQTFDMITAASQGLVCCWLMTSVTTVFIASTGGRKSTINLGSNWTRNSTSIWLP